MNGRNSVLKACSGTSDAPCDHLGAIDRVELGDHLPPRSWAEAMITKAMIAATATTTP